MKIVSYLELLVLIFLATLVFAEDNDKSNLLNLSEIDVYSKAERVKYAINVKEQLFMPIYQTIPVLTEQERTWLENEKKILDEDRNDLKHENIQSRDEREVQEWYEKRKRYVSTTLYLQNQARHSLRRAIAALNLIINSKNLTIELYGWSLLIDELLSRSFREENASKIIKELEKNKNMTFKNNILFMHGVSIDIAKDINQYVIINYFEEKIK